MTPGFDHINITARDQEALRDFLADVLGVTVGPRPPFDWHGYWLYLGDRAVIHTAPRDHTLGPGWADHIAFGPFNFDRKVAELEAAGHSFRVSQLPGTDTRQIFVEGPEGLRVELQCPRKTSA